MEKDKKIDFYATMSKAYAAARSVLIDAFCDGKISEEVLKDVNKCVREVFETDFEEAKERDEKIEQTGIHNHNS